MLYGSDTYFPGVAGFAFASVAGILLIGAWIILAGSRFVHGGVVERSDRIPQLYGYTVCLIALIWALMSVISIVENALSLSAPELRAAPGFGWEPSVTSFEAFRTTYDRSREMMSPNRTEKLDTIPEPELRRRFEALKADRVMRARYEAQRILVIKSLSFLIAAALFVFHWRWLKRTGISGRESHPA
jgi:hypothetical protein